MKKIKILIVLLLALFYQGKAQTVAPINNNSGFQISLRGGYDIPNFKNNTPYIDYKGGLELGASIDYYWSWYGLGADVDYINSGSKSNYPLTNLYNSSGTPITNFTLQEDKITRLFYGIGPDFRYVSSNTKFQAELNTRIGFSSIKGGKVELRETSTSANQLLNFHAGYDLGSSLSAKAQVRFTYFLTNSLGIHLGAYYLKHFDGTELVDPSLSITTGYQSFTSNLNNGTVIGNQLTSRVEPCNCDLSSIGLFAGLTLKLHASGAKKCNICDKYALAVTARDKYTKELLPFTDVALKDAKGNVVKTGTTNSFGVVVFDYIDPDNYTIEGVLYDVKLEGTTVAKSEFKVQETVQKEILYSDMNFILKGKAVVCNTSKPISGVSVVLKNTTLGEQKSTITNDKGEYIFNVKQQAEYTIYGKKENYFSQIETISTKDFDRNTTLFVKLEVCMDEADCGKAIKLKNILYDLDKFYIKDLAKKELNRLVQFMQDNPGIKVEVSSHTDSRASNEYNMTLSQNRADAAVDYVVSQGIERSRIKGVGYGETRLLNKCSDGVECTEAQHQINRRTEMKVICPDKK